MNPLPSANESPRQRLLQAFWSAVDGAPSELEAVRFHDEADWPCAFELGAFAAAAVAASGLALAALSRAQRGGNAALPGLRVSQRLCGLWFGFSLRPQGWQLPAPWDAVAGDYRCADGWIRLHTNAPHHRAAALELLQVPAEREAVSAAVAGWSGEALESAIVERGGCAAAMRSRDEWQAHPQGRAVLAEPLLERRAGDAAARGDWDCTAARPLQGLRVLDLTRVLAGPVATRLLAGLGAQVLRIDPPGWDEPAVVPEMTPGKRCARLDLRDAAGRERWQALLQGADVLVHGYRSDALEALGLGAATRRRLRPGLVDVSLDAYGFSGPWAARRGFDSLVQMSMGIAEAGRRAAGGDRPRPLPVQALDHATGYLLAAAVLRGLETRWRSGRGSQARTSLARTGALLMSEPRNGLSAASAPMQESDADLAPAIENTAWGPARRLRWPFEVDGVCPGWDRPARGLGDAQAAWSD